MQFSEEEYTKAKLKFEGGSVANCVLAVGEIVNFKGGTFRVKSFGKKMVVLEGVPGTSVGSW